MSIVLISNPAAGSACARKVERAELLMKAQGYEVQVLWTAHAGHASELASRAAALRPRLVMAAGGDGTMSEVAQGLRGTGVPMAVLPLGTVNVLARELGVPRDVEGAVRVALEGEARAVSLGYVDMGGAGRRSFVLMAGLGFDALAVCTVSTRLKRVVGKAAYVASALGVLVSWNPQTIRMSFDEHVHEGCWLLVANAARYAGDFKLAPLAEMQDQWLHAYLLEPAGRVDLFRFIVGIMRGKLEGVSGVVHRRCQRIRIEPQGAHAVQVDGDCAGAGVLEIGIEPGALQLIWPPLEPRWPPTG